MTLIMGAETKTKVIIASDSLGSSSSRQEVYGSKLIRVKNFIVGYSHSYKTAQLIEFNKGKFKPIHTRRDIYNFCLKLKALMIKDGHKKESSAEESDLCHTVLLIMATEFGLFEISANYQFLKLKRSAVGCGTIYGLGYFDGCSSEINTRRRLVKSIRAASKFVPRVGGPIYVKEVTLRKQVNDRMS